jgi:hypothetical protein
VCILYADLSLDLACPRWCTHACCAGTGSCVGFVFHKLKPQTISEYVSEARNESVCLFVLVCA